MAAALRRFGRSVETLIGSDVREGELDFAALNVVAGLLWIWIALQLRRRQVALVAVPRPVFGGALALSGGVP